MNKYILLVLSLIIALNIQSETFPHVKPVMLLLGFDTGVDDNNTHSYGKMYDNTDTSDENLEYSPFKTVGFTRRNNKITIKTAPYLIAPTVKGFKYINLVNNRSELTTEDMDEYLAEAGSYEGYNWSTDTTKIVISSDKNDIKNSKVKLNNEDALYTYYETIDYITPDFFIKRGYKAEVHFGATWFDAEEFIEVIPFGKPVSGNLKGLISEKDYISVLQKAHNDIYGEPPLNDNSFPWDSGPWYKKDDCSYSLFRKEGIIHLKALVPCWGNSARRFLAGVDLGKAPALLVKSNELPVKLNSFKDKHKDPVDVIISPDSSTFFVLTSTDVYIYDNSNTLLLASFKLKDLIPNGYANKIIMSEWAMDSYVSKWESVF